MTRIVVFAILFLAFIWLLTRLMSRDGRNQDPLHGQSGSPPDVDF